MTLRSVLKVTEKYVIDNSPTLLAAIAATGVATTAYLTGKATFKAAKIIAEENANRDLQELGVPLTKKESAQLVWKEYIPSTIALTGTIGCIVMSNSISASRLTALAAAYKISEKHYAEYKDKVLEKFGEKKVEEVREEIHKEAINRTSLPYRDDDDLLPDDSLYPGTRRTWCFDLYSGRYFKSDMQTIRSIANDINRQIIDDTYVRLTEFYDRLGLPETKLSGEIGWTLEHPLDLKFTTQLADGNGGVPVLVLDFARTPTSLRDYRFFPESSLD